MGIGGFFKNAFGGFFKSIFSMIAPAPARPRQPEFGAFRTVDTPTPTSRAESGTIAAAAKAAILADRKRKGQKDTIKTSPLGVGKGQPATKLSLLGGTR